MISAVFSMHTYWIVNVAIAICYLLARIVLKIRYIQRQLSQQQQLRFARYSFLLAIIAFLITPIIANWFAVEHSNLEFKPIIHHASMSFLRHHENIATEISSVQTLSTQISFSKIVIFAWIAGFFIFNYSFVQNISLLNIVRKEALIQHRIHRTSVLISSHTQIPFCFSLLHQHFVVLPFSILENKQDRILAIRHELQHIRQGDTYWLQFMSIMKLICFWNPFLILWMRWFNELQEFACDEAMILRRKTSPVQYAQCLINTIKGSMAKPELTNSILAISGMSTSILKRRVNMLFQYNNQKRKFTLITAYCMSFCALASTAYALNASSASVPLTEKEVASIIKEADVDNVFHISANPEVTEKMNSIRNNKKDRQYILGALDRMKTYQPYIQSMLKKNGMPSDLLAIPLVESGYRPLDESKNPVKAAGIWQIIPSTAKKLGLTINPNRDDRLDTALSTQAALHYLNKLHSQFHDWKLAILAYEIGEDEVDRLIKETGSRNVWVIARSSHVPEKYKFEVRNYLAMFDASVIIMHNPSLVT